MANVREKSPGNPGWYSHLREKIWDYTEKEKDEEKKQRKKKIRIFAAGHGDRTAAVSGEH